MGRAMASRSASENSTRHLLRNRPMLDTRPGARRDSLRNGSLPRNAATGIEEAGRSRQTGPSRLGSPATNPSDRRRRNLRPFLGTHHANREGDRRASENREARRASHRDRFPSQRAATRLETHLPQQWPTIRSRDVSLHEGAAHRMRPRHRTRAARSAGAVLRGAGASNLPPGGQARAIRRNPRNSGGPSRPVDADMILRGARVAQGPDCAAPLDIEIRSGKILALRNPSKPPRGAATLDLGGCLILPGLINAHDHLEFILYPRLGRGPNANAGAWGRAAYPPEKSPVGEQLPIPKTNRFVWEGLSN